MGLLPYSLVVVLVVRQSFRSIFSKLIANYFMFLFIHSHSFERVMTEDCGVIAALLEPAHFYLPPPLPPSDGCQCQQWEEEPAQPPTTPTTTLPQMSMPAVGGRTVLIGQRK